MKTLIQLALFFTCCASEVPALAQDTLYYNAIWKEITADKASYFRIKTRSTIGWQVSDCFLSGKPQMKGGLSYRANNCLSSHDCAIGIVQGEGVKWTKIK